MPRSSIAALAVGTALALSACTASRYQISDALQRYGLSPSKAACAADFLRGRLSTGQINRLARAARYYNAAGPLTFGDLVRVGREVGDADIALQVGATALACGIVADVPIPRF